MKQKAITPKARWQRTRQIGRRIATARAASGLSLSQLSAALGNELGKSALSNYEQGLRRPGIEEAELLASLFSRAIDPALGHAPVTAAYLLGIETEGLR